jgi:hypothetical protein
MAACGQRSLLVQLRPSAGRHRRSIGEERQRRTGVSPVFRGVRVHQRLFGLSIAPAGRGTPCAPPETGETPVLRWGGLTSWFVSTKLMSRCFGLTPNLAPNYPLVAASRRVQEPPRTEGVSSGTPGTAVANCCTTLTAGLRHEVTEGRFVLWDRRVGQLLWRGRRFPKEPGDNLWPVAY